MILPKELGRRLLRVISAKLTQRSVLYTDILRPFVNIIAVIHIDDTTLLLGLIVEATVEMGFEPTTLGLCIRCSNRYTTRTHVITTALIKPT